MGPARDPELPKKAKHCIAKAIYGISRAISRPGSFSMFSRIETHLGRCV